MNKNEIINLVLEVFPDSRVIDDPYLIYDPFMDDYYCLYAKYSDTSVKYDFFNIDCIECSKNDCKGKNCIDCIVLDCKERVTKNNAPCNLRKMITGL